MRKLSKDVLTRHAQYLHDRTGGYFLYLSQLICGAAVAAILDGTEDITREHLQAIRIGREERPAQPLTTPASTGRHRLQPPPRPHRFRPHPSPGSSPL